MIEIFVILVFLQKKFIIVFVKVYYKYRRIILYTNQVLYLHNAQWLHKTNQVLI